MKPPNPIDRCCPPLFSGRMSPEKLSDIAHIFRVLGEPARLQLLNLIAAQPTQKVRACELVEALGLSQPTVSHHLKVLYEAGLLTKERDGTLIHYQLVAERLAELRSALA
jgi:ArsR family transcriptional regulator, arsenate/arsenite/antimonite-responsive transcriptional repressor